MGKLEELVEPKTYYTFLTFQHAHKSYKCISKKLQLLL